MHRFFVDQTQIDEKYIHISGQDAHHIRTVLRMREKEEILVSDGDKMEYTCQIEKLADEEILAKIMFVEEAGLELPAKVYLFQCLPKSDKM